MEEIGLNKDNNINFIFYEDIKKWEIITYKKEKIVSKKIVSEKTGVKILFEYCMFWKCIDLKRYEEEIRLKHETNVIGSVRYIEEKQIEKPRKHLITRFLYDIFDGGVLLNQKVVPGFHHLLEGIRLAIFDDKIILDNIFSENNQLSLEEQEFFKSVFKEFNNYQEFLDSQLGQEIMELTFEPNDGIKRERTKEEKL